VIDRYVNKLHEGPAFVHHKPVALDSQREALRIFGRCALVSQQERPIDLLDIKSRPLLRAQRSNSSLRMRFAFVADNDDDPLAPPLFAQ
jgi:hypothetical protein